MSLLKKYRIWKQRDFLKWRDELTEYERDFFLPEIKGRCEALLTYFKEIDVYCNDRKYEHNFGLMLRKLNLNGLDESRFPETDRPQTPKKISEDFFSSIQIENRKSFIEPLEKILLKIRVNVSLKDFGSIMNEVNLICSIVVQAKSKLFLYRLSSFAYVQDTNTKQVVLAPPRELSVLLLQFQSSLDNIFNIANSTSSTLHQWHKEQMQWKTEYLKVLSERIAQRNNLLSILVAVAVSWALLTATQPLEKYQLNKENELLKNEVIDARIEIEKLTQDKRDLSFIITNLKDSIQRTENSMKGQGNE
tara:strand:- start:1300 stop:2214 length:915 start_codon:yes stop_codon:yes gene_type:complete